MLLPSLEEIKKQFEEAKLIWSHFGKSHWSIQALIGLLIFVIIGLVGNSVLLKGKIETSENKADQLEGRITELSGSVGNLRYENESLQRDNLYYKSTLKPLEAKMEKYYPDMDIPAAIEKLAKDIEKVHEIAASKYYKPLNKDIRNKIITYLKEFRLKHDKFPIIGLSLEQGASAARRNAIEDLKNILVSADFEVNGVDVTISSGGAIAPIIVTYNSQNFELAHKLIIGLDPFISGSIKFLSNDNIGIEEIHIDVQGEVEFLPNGCLVFR